MWLPSALGVLAGVAAGAFLPAVVPPERLVEANSRLQAAGSAAEVVGPGTAGALVQTLTAPVAIAADALSYLASALLIGRLLAPEPATGAAMHPGSLHEIAQGLGIALRHPLLGPLALAATLAEFFDSAFFSQYPLHAVRELGVAPAALGFIFALGGAGGLAGALLAGWAARRCGVGRALIGGALLIGAGDALVPLAPFLPARAVPLLAAAELIVALGT